jgi:hypothetical protein
MSAEQRVLADELTVTYTTPSRDGSPSAKLMTLGLSALFGTGLIMLVVGYALNVDALRLIGLFGVLFFGIGTAPLQLHKSPSLATRLGVAGLVGLSILTLVATVMVLTPLWHPLAFGVIIGGAATAVHVESSRRAVHELHRSEFIRIFGGGRVKLDAPITCILVGTVLWCGAALDSGHITPGVGGFLPHVPVFWYLGLVLLVAGVIVSRDKSEAHLALALVSLVAALTLTPALLYGMPPQSAGKHVDLVQQILSTHHLNRDANIFEAYPGFFAGIAWLCDLAQVRDSLTFAAYWPFLISLVGLAELRFLFGRLIRSKYRIWAGVTLVVLVTAIGNYYFSPQSVGYVIDLGVYGLVMGLDWPGPHNRIRIGLLALAGCSLAVTHQLSPYIASGVLIVLVIFRAARPWFAPAMCLLPAAAWALFNWHVVAYFATFSSIGNLANFAPPKTIATPGLHRLAIVGESSDALLFGLLVLIALAAVGFVRKVRSLPALGLLSRPPAWGFLISAGVGLALITVNPYGNEGIFRAALFGIPWLALLATAAVPDNPPRWMPAVSGLTAVGLLALLLVSSFGLDNADVIRPADLQAYSTYESHASPSSYLLDLSYGQLPYNVAFPENGHLVAWTTLVTGATFQPGRPNAADVDALAERYIRLAAKDGGARNELYALWSPASAAYAVDYGLETYAHAQTWQRLMAASPDWEVVFSHDGTYLFRVVMPRA